MNRIIYWLSYLINDILIFVVPLIVLIICIVAAKIKSLNMNWSLFVVFVSYMLHVPDNLLFIYTLSFIFGKSTKILNFVSLFCNIITINILTYLALEPWCNTNFYSPSSQLALRPEECHFSCFSFFYGRSVWLTEVFLFLEIFFNDNCRCYNFFEN